MPAGLSPTGILRISIMFSTIISVYCLLLVGCSGATPSGFWKNYHKSLIAEQYSDQGPWGGLRWIQWASKQQHAFSEEEALSFAKQNGWKLLTRTTHNEDSMSGWFDDSNPIFPLYATSDSDSSDLARLPRHILGKCILLTFDSGWLREDPGTNEMSTSYGYILLSTDGERMAVYHFWGNG